MPYSFEFVSDLREKLSKFQLQYVITVLFMFHSFFPLSYKIEEFVYVLIFFFFFCLFSLYGQPEQQNPEDDKFFLVNKH